MSRPVRLVLIAIFAIVAVQVMLLILVPLKAVAVGIPASTAGAVIAAWGLLGLLADFPAAALSDAVGRRRVIAAGGGAMALAAAVLAVATDLPGILAGMVLFGLGQSLSFGPALAFLTEVTPGDLHARVQGINGAAQWVSTVVAAILAGVLVPFGYGIAMCAAFALAIASAVAILSVDRSLELSTRVSRPSGVLNSYRRALDMIAHRPQITFAAMLSIVYAIGFLVITSSVLPLVLVEFDGMSPELVGILIGLRNLVAAALSLTFPWAIRRVGLVRASVLTSWLAVLGTGGLAVVMVAPELIWIPLLLQAGGMAYGAAATNVLVTRSTSADERAVGMSATVVTSRLSVLAVPLLLAPLVAPATAPVAFLVAGIVCVPAVLAMAAVGRRIPEQSGSRAMEGSTP